jgi:formylglycine-generating enzyme required for sulfatase activity
MFSNMRSLLTLTLLALGYQTASAQLVTESFGTGANAFTMDFVTIGNPNNAADTTGSPNPAGAVAYTYNLGKYEVSREQITKANAAGSLGITMFDMTNFGGNGINKPATGVSWYEAATYVNWLNTSTGGTAAYKFSGSTFQLWSSTDAGYNANNLFRNSLAKYVIASSNEWYKGAYGKADGSWSNFLNGTDSAPTAVASGTDPNTAVYAGQAGPADINNAGGLSSYGTMGQGGNVWEWNETAIDGSNSTAGESRELRGGAWGFDSLFLDASFRSSSNPSNEGNFNLGFRVAMADTASVPEPSAFSLLAIGLGGLAILRRRK